jgi:hypothetical protein
MCCGKPNQFTSLFWIERQWIFEAKNQPEYITYLIQPYKYIEKKDFQYKIIVFIIYRKR